MSELTILFDGHCPICRRKAMSLQRRDRDRGRLRIADIHAADVDLAAYGLTFDAVNQRMHGILADGTVVVGMDAVRRAYAAVGRGWMLAPTGWRVLRKLFDAFYEWFARHRHAFVGWGSECMDGKCERPGSRT